MFLFLNSFTFFIFLGFFSALWSFKFYLSIILFSGNAMVVNSNQSNVFFVVPYFLTFIYTHLTASLVRVSKIEIWQIWLLILLGFLRLACSYFVLNILYLSQKIGSVLNDVNGISFKHLWSLMVFRFPRTYCIVRLSHWSYAWYTRLFLETLLCLRFFLKFVLFLDEYWGFSSSKTFLWMFSV